MQYKPSTFHLPLPLPPFPLLQAEVLRDSGGVDPRLHTDMRHCRPYQLAEERGNTGLAKVGAWVYDSSRCGGWSVN